VNYREIIFYALLVIVGILPIFVRSVLLRSICICLLLVAASIACVGVTLSAHTARNRLAETQSPTAKSFLEMGSPFRQGSNSAAQAAQESLPVFVIVIGALAVMALVSAERPKRKAGATQDI